MNSEPRGQIITFYSYKGGTGRTMALANIACLLAERQQDIGGKGVLMVDWDLEAPGLHRFFHDKLSSRKRMMEEPDELRPGLIDLFSELENKVDHRTEYSEVADLSPSSEKLARWAVQEINLQEYIIPTTIRGLSLLKAGRFGSKKPNEYSERVNKFNWEALYQKSPHLIRVFAETIAADYAYVLVDSRTGVTDISGICTMLLPEKLVVVFTPNIQSLKGGLDLIRRATDYRKESADLRPLLVFPLVSRVEANEPDLRHDWRFGNSHGLTIGYQPEFEELLSEVYQKKGITLTEYFDEIQIQHVPRYAYGEEIAVLSEKSEDKFSLRRSYQTFAKKLIGSDPAWEGEITGQGIYGRTSNKVLTLLRNRLYGILLLLPNHPFAVLFLTVSILFSAGMFSAYSSQRVQRAEAARIQAIEEAAVLKEQLAELQRPLEILAVKEETIKNLYDQLDQVSQDRDNARLEALKVRTQAAAAQRAADQVRQQYQDLQMRNNKLRYCLSPEDFKRCMGKGVF